MHHPRIALECSILTREPATDRRRLASHGCWLHRQRRDWSHVNWWNVFRAQLELAETATRILQFPIEVIHPV